jgi:acylphosphatase
MPMDVCAHIVVSGRVQGVGFRYFTMRIARKRQLTGWVRNLPGGDVEIEVEGPRGLIESLLKDLKVGNTWAQVTDIDVQWSPFSGKYTGFDITY